ncbi:MAG: hypothetical protein KDD35_11960 [Bdellovibrionales bacterium]|nr:hypothetical protein [Bdellovibrionales bacterium]
MSPYEYPDFWFPGCFEMEACVDPYHAREFEPGIDDPPETRIDRYAQVLVDFLERLSGGRKTNQPPTKPAAEAVTINI